MSSQVWIRPYDRARDHALLAEWLHASRDRNRFDPDVFLRGRAAIYTAFDESGQVGFIPVVNGNQVESLAFRPGLPAVTQAKAFRAWQAVFIYQSFEKNVPDAFFVTFDEQVLGFAAKYGWRKVVVPMMNLHFDGLEKGKGD